MKSLFATGSGLLALAIAASAAMPGSAMADDTINKVNDSMIQTQQMDYLVRTGKGYMIQQDQYSAGVGGRNSTIVSPAPRVFVPAPAQTYVVTPAPGYYVTR